MSDIDERRDIQTCREHHAHIDSMLVRFPPIARPEAGAIAEALAALKTLLVRHLNFEDEHLYPRLIASKDPVVVATAVRFQSEMGGLAPQCLAFFDRWQRADTIANAVEEFEREWLGLRDALERRILAEDNDLYELAETGTLEP